MRDDESPKKRQEGSAFVPLYIVDAIRPKQKGNKIGKTKRKNEEETIDAAETNSRPCVSPIYLFIILEKINFLGVFFFSR